MSALVPTNGTMTSAEAARAASANAETDEEKVIRVIRAAGVSGLTRDEICAAAKLGGDSVRPRCWSLLRRRLIVVSDEIRRNANGRACEVLISAAVLP